MNAAFSDFTQTVRGFAREPLFVATVGVVLALGIGVSTAIFAAVDTLLVRPLPYVESERLVDLSTRRSTDAGTRIGVSFLDVLDLKAAGKSFERLAAYRVRSFAFEAKPGSGEPAIVQVGQVSADFFTALGAEPRPGRSWSEDEEVAEASVVVVSTEFWRSRLGSDPDVVGRRVFFNEESRTVLGVLPAGFTFAIDDRVPEAYIPLSRTTYAVDRNVRTLAALGRLVRGTTIEEASAELATQASRLAASYPESNVDRGFALVTLHEKLRGGNRRPLRMLAIAGLLLLAVTCLDVANLLVARFLTRRHRLAMRAVLGAGLIDLARLFLMEGVVLSALGALVGVGVAGLSLQALPLVLEVLGGVPLPAGIPPPEIDLRVLAVAVGLSATTTLVFALVPTLLARRSDLAQLVKDTSPPVSWRRRVTATLVVAQIALSMVLTLAAGLLLRSFYEILTVNPGFETEGVVRFGLGLPETRYPEEEILRFHRRLEEKIASIEGVDAVGAAFQLPIRPQVLRTRFALDGEALSRDSSRAVINVASGGFFEALSIPLLSGRLFGPEDVAAPASARVALVNEAFRRAYLGDNATGRSLGGRSLGVSWWSKLNPRGLPWEIIGVVGDTRQRSLEIETEPAIYLPLGQFPSEGAVYVVRGEREVFTEIRDAVEAIDPGLGSFAFSTVAETVSQSLHGRRLALLLVALFAAVALALSGVGVFGVVAFLVRERRREVAIRMSLGAEAEEVARLVLFQGLRLAIPGAVVGTVLFYWTGRAIESQLYGVGRMDPLTVGGVALVLCSVALVASYAPARRAARTSPATVLRGKG